MRGRKRKDQLTLRADGGSPMQSKTAGQLLVVRGVTRSLSRPYMSSDNPRSEAQFKTMKCRPDYLNRLSSREQSRVWVGFSTGATTNPIIPAWG
jgi:putative transposase